MVVSLGAGVVADGRMRFLVVVVASVSVIVGIVAISIFLIIIETAGLEAMPTSSSMELPDETSTALILSRKSSPSIACPNIV